MKSEKSKFNSPPKRTDTQKSRKSNIGQNEEIENLCDEVLPIYELTKLQEKVNHLSEKIGVMHIHLEK